MKVQAVAVVGVLFVVCLAFDMLALGGAAQRYHAVAAQARAESPLAQTYIVLDRYAAKWIPGVEGASKALANATFSASWPAVEAQPEVALTVLFSHSHGALAPLLKLAYWSAPILLLIFLFLLWRRPRPVHLIGG
ncbi:MAG: hypothetical protein L0H70_07285 [Xanthomonadales bacterium]|nr:hypothetical protein [Xanthomonadales bacterium]